MNAFNNPLFGRKKNIMTTIATLILRTNNYCGTKQYISKVRKFEYKENVVYDMPSDRYFKDHIFLSFKMILKNSLGGIKKMKIKCSACFIKVMNQCIL